MVSCPACLQEAGLFQDMVASLRALPVIEPPADFVERTTARWVALRCSASPGTRGERSLMAGPPTSPEETTCCRGTRMPLRMVAPSLPRAPLPSIPSPFRPRQAAWASQAQPSSPGGGMPRSPFLRRRRHSIGVRVGPSRPPLSHRFRHALWVLFLTLLFVAGVVAGRHLT